MPLRCRLKLITSTLIGLDYFQSLDEFRYGLILLKDAVFPRILDLVYYCRLNRSHSKGGPSLADIKFRASAGSIRHISHGSACAKCVQVCLFLIT